MFKQKQAFVKFESKKLKIKEKNTTQSDFKIIEFNSVELSNLEEKKTKKLTSLRKDSNFKLHHFLSEGSLAKEEEVKIIEKKANDLLIKLSDKTKLEASKEGYEEGFKKGYEEGIEKFYRENTNKIEIFENLIKSLEKTRKEIFIENEHFFIELIFKISRLFLLKEINLDKEYLLRINKEIFEKITIDDHIVIRMSSDDFKLIDSLNEKILNSIGNEKKIHIEYSDQIPRGGCQVATSWSTFDTNIDMRLEKIFESLLGEFNKN